jgi:insertion element IS1 protein InsB
VKEQIIKMTRRLSGIRDIAVVLEISPSTVINTIRKYANSIEEPPAQNFVGDIEVDEQWSYVQNKHNQRWLSYALSRTPKRVIAFHIGKRDDQSCKTLLSKLPVSEIPTFYTDGWLSYSKFISEDKHIISKKETQNIERNNLNYRTHIKRLSRKTICFSKADVMHYNVIKIYTHYFNST